MQTKSTLSGLGMGGEYFGKLVARRQRVALLQLPKFKCMTQRIQRKAEGREEDGRRLFCAVARELEEMFMHGGVVGQLRMKCGGKNAALADQHRMARVLGENFDALPY